MTHIDRRSFLKTAGAGALALGLSGRLPAEAGYASQVAAQKNALPRWRGFNLLDFYSTRPYVRPTAPRSSVTTEDDFKWMRDWGFDFVRIPMGYPTYIQFDAKGDRNKHITPEETVLFNESAVEEVEKLVYQANQNGLHVSLNLHRAPGFCINAGFNEPFNLWKDAEAQEAFYTHWEMWAKRFRNISAEQLSFDLVNEPCFREDMNDQYSKKSPVPGDIYRKIARGCLERIHKYNPDRLVVADGNDGGSLVIPELTDLKIGQSCRGYSPGEISHYRASWVYANPDDAPYPNYPGTINGKKYDRKYLEDFYKPWTDLVKQGVGVHCGECGCYRETPHEIFLAWFGDVIGILTENNIGYALWNFKGDFGFLDSGRKDIAYEDWYGHKLDRKMLELLQKN